MTVQLIDSMGSDLTVVNAARVSFSKSKDVMGLDDEKLIQYLAKHKHWSPFAHTSLQFRIKAPVFVARQLAKHQVGGVWNEVSRRYVDHAPELYSPTEWRGRAENKKQGSFGTVENWNDRVALFYAEALDLYEEMLKANVCPEQARMILPLGSMTEWIWTGSLYFFARVCNQRINDDAQQETAEVARMINRAITYTSDRFTHSWAALRSAK